MTIKEAVDLIQSDQFKEDIERLRESDNPSIQTTLKNVLPYITFSGVFTERKNSALKEHSGLLVLDFDGLENERLKTFFSELQSLEWVCAVWVSPRGNGLKVVVKIKPESHLDTFNALSDFFVGNFNIDVDPSGKDVSRACFISWDPGAYYNPSSSVYMLAEEVFSEEPKPTKQSPQKTKSTRKSNVPKVSANKLARDIQRVQYVIEQIERDKVDITDNDYDNRRDIGFALATLGEPAREYYKRAVQFNDHEEDVDDDQKFDDALKNGRFSTPAKFFSLAKNCGLEIVIPKTIQQKQKAADIKSVISEEDSAEEQIQYGIHFDKKTQTYWSLDSKSIPREITNFSLRILYHVNTGAEEAFRLMQIKNIHGLEKILRINTDDFVSAGSFKKVIARLGNFIWKGQEHDLVRLQDMLQRHERHTEMVNTLGWNKKWKFYAFANGLYDTVKKKFSPIDEYGIVERQKDDKMMNFFVPALSKVFADKDDLYTNEKKFIFVDSKVGYNDWSTQFVKVFGDNGRIGLVFWVCALFSDILFRSMGQRMPMPFAYGKRGSGKGTMIQSLTRMWGDKQDQIMLGGATTVVGFMRKMAQFSNGLVWLDEYKNNLQIKVIESIKNLYDRIGYERGKKDNGFSTESTPILSAVFLSGQEMPTAEPALFTRTILLTFSETKRTEKDREEYRKLLRMEEEGLSHLTVDLLSNREDIERDFQQTYEQELRDLSTDVNNNDIDERLLGNYSMLIATARIMDNLNLLPFSIDVFKTQCISILMNQYFILKGSDDTSKFWQVVEQLVSTYIIKEEEHYKLANGYIYIYIQDIYHHYVKAMNDRREVNILDKPTLENYLKSDAKSFIAKTKKSIGNKYTWAMQFTYKELEIDLIRGVSESEIRQKYMEMKLEYKNEASQPDDGFPTVEQTEINF